ncbi:MAG: hypothetical protein LBH63_02750 [Clostridiales Family XIII bacterium]|jgi:UDP-3-O-[3-hydroxymyristoyl] glucosamine N-acyltransferase|nr:hypothetical protein [Clostridiales Family XIII bacterium]
MKEIYIIGAGDFGKEIADTIHAINRVKQTFHIVGYIDDDNSRKGETINDLEIIGDTDEFIRISRRRAEGFAKTEKSDISKDRTILPSAVISVADPIVKSRLARKLDGHAVWENIIHPTASISPYATFGQGIVIQSFVYAAPNAMIENHAHVNVLSSVGHDVRVGEFSSVMVQSALSGFSTLGQCAYIATGVTILPGIHIGSNTHVGAGSVVTKDLPDDVVAYGSPCKAIRRNR